MQHFRTAAGNDDIVCQGQVNLFFAAYTSTTRENVITKSQAL